MKSYITLYLLLLVITSCTNNTSCYKPLDYDEIIHYSIEPDEEEVSKYFEFQNRITHSDSNAQKNQLFNKKLFDIIFEEESITHLSDSPLVKQLSGIGVKRKVLPANIFSSIDSAFCVEETNPDAEDACVPIYRDILVFEKNNRITGWIKLCFECDRSTLIDSKRTYNISHKTNFNTLKQLLDNN